MSIRTKLLAAFREIFVYHHKSLEFRAKIYAVILAAGSDDVKNCDWELMAKIASKIYTDRRREEILVHTTKEYVSLILRSPVSIYDEFVKEIDYRVKKNKTNAKKINIEDIKALMKSGLNEEQQLLQQRLYEFLSSQSKEE